MTTDAARRAVFDTPELLENIILFLPVKDVFAKVQRLCRPWKSVVDFSHAIQTKLWLRSQSGNVIQPTKYSNDHAFEICDWFQELASPIYPPGVVLNPFLRIEPPNFYTTLMSPFFEEDPESPCAVTLFGHSRSVNGNDRPAVQSSRNWRNMYLTEPPITTASLRVYLSQGSGDNSSSWIESAIRDPNGITLGLFYDMSWASIPLDMQDSLVPIVASGHCIRSDILAFFQ
jgi:hypothetical protein